MSTDTPDKLKPADISVDHPGDHQVDQPAGKPAEATTSHAATEAVQGLHTLIKNKSEGTPTGNAGGDVKYNTPALYSDKDPAAQPAEQTQAPGEDKTAEQDAEALHKLSGKDSWYSFDNRSIFADKDGINNFLLTKTDAQREAIKPAYERKYHQPMEEAFHFNGENDSDYQKFQSILNRKSSDLAGQASDRIGYALTEEKQGPIHRRDQNIVEQDIRDTLRTHSHEQIEVIKADYAKAHSGHTLQDDIANDANLSKQTKDAAAIYLKGNDKLTSADRENLVQLALQKRDITMFGEAMQGMDKSERLAFMRKGGQTAIEKAFNTAEGAGPAGERIAGETTQNTMRAMDIANKGEVSAATEIGSNVGAFRTNREGVEHAIDKMSDQERRQYQIGKALAGNQPIPPELNGDNLTDADKIEAVAVYNTTHDVLAAAGNDSQVAKWEGQIAKTKGTLVGSLADHRGILWNDGKADILKDIAGMSKEDFENARAHPETREEVHQQLERLKGMRLNETDVGEIMKAYDQKIGAKDYESSLHTGNGDVIENIKDCAGILKTDHRAVLAAIANMTPEEQERYSSDAGFKKELDDQVARYTSTVPSDQQAEGVDPGGPAYDAARRMLDGVTAGQEPKQDVVSALAGDATDSPNDQAQIIRDLQQAFKDDPTLRERLIKGMDNAQNSDDQKLSKDVIDMLHQCLGKQDFDTYAEPLIQTGHLAIEQQMDLDKGMFVNDNQGAFKDILNATPDEIKRMQTDPSYRDRVLDVFSNDEDKKVALNILKQGEAKPEDQIRERINHWGGTTQIMDVLKKIQPEELEEVRNSYQEKYGSSLEGDLYSKLGSDDKKEAAREMAESIEGEKAYNIARDAHYKEVSGFGARVLTNELGINTVAQAQDTLGDYTQAVADTNKNHEELKASEGKELREKLFKADDAVAKAKEDTADTVSELGIAAGVVVTAPFTGGLSLAGTAEAALALGTVGAVGQVAAKGSIMDSDYDWSIGNVSVDAGTGFAESAVGGVGPGQAAKLLGFGGRAGAAAAAKANAALAGEGSEDLLKEGGQEELVTASKELMTDSLSEGNRTIEAKEVHEIAEKVVAENLTGEAREEAIGKIAGTLQEDMQEALTAENKHFVKAATERATVRGISGFAAGITGGAVDGASDWDGSMGVAANLDHIGEKALMAGAAVGGASVGLSVGIEAIDPVFEKLANRAIVRVEAESAEHTAEGRIEGGLDQEGLVKNKNTLKDKIMEKGQDTAMEATNSPEPEAGTEGQEAGSEKAQGDSHETVLTANSSQPFTIDHLIDSDVDTTKVKNLQEDSSISS